MKKCKCGESMGNVILTEFKEYIDGLEEADKALIDAFFKNIEQRCLISKSERKKMILDFENAVIYYVKKGFKLKKILELLDPINLGGFYARPTLLWFPLDDSAKIYPMSLEHDNMPLFRLSAYLVEDLVPELLQMALIFTIKRFPCFATTLKKGIFWHYLDTTKRRFTINEENDVPCQPLRVSRSGSQTFRVIYYKNRVSIEFFHVLTDGIGGMVFLKALVAEYLRLTGVDIKENDDVWNINDIPNVKETRNEFARVPHSSNTSGLINKRVLQMNGKLTNMKPNQVIHFKFAASKLKEKAQEYNATVTIFMLAILFIAIKAATDSLNGEVSIQVPVNMRKFYPSDTLRNFAMYCGIKFDIEEIEDIPSLINAIKVQLDEKANKDKMSEMITSANKLVSSLRFIPLFIKLPIAKKLYGFLGDQAFTSTLSNLGVVKMPDEYNKHILSMDFVLGTAPNNRAITGLVTFNNVTTFSVSKMTKDPTFEEKLYELFIKEGLDVEVEGSGIYEY